MGLLAIASLTTLFSAHSSNSILSMSFSPALWILFFQFPSAALPNPSHVEAALFIALATIVGLLSSERGVTRCDQNVISLNESIDGVLLVVAIRLAGLFVRGKKTRRI